MGSMSLPPVLISVVAGSLEVAEIGGFLVLFYGVILAVA